MRELALGLFQAHLVGTRVYLRQEVALLHHLTFLVPNIDKLAVDLGLHGDSGERRHRAQLVQDDTDVALVDGGGSDRLRRGLGGTADFAAPGRLP